MYHFTVRVFTGYRAITRRYDTSWQKHKFRQRNRKRRIRKRRSGKRWSWKRQIGALRKAWWVADLRRWRRFEMGQVEFWPAGSEREEDRGLVEGVPVTQRWPAGHLANIDSPLSLAGCPCFCTHCRLPLLPSHFLFLHSVKVVSLLPQTSPPPSLLPVEPVEVSRSLIPPLPPPPPLRASPNRPCHHLKALILVLQVLYTIWYLCCFCIQKKRKKKKLDYNGFWTAIVIPIIK